MVPSSNQAKQANRHGLPRCTQLEGLALAVVVPELFELGVKPHQRRVPLPAGEMPRSPRRPIAAARRRTVRTVVSVARDAVRILKNILKR
jgi:hypothetical protein